MNVWTKYIILTLALLFQVVFAQEQLSIFGAVDVGRVEKGNDHLLGGDGEFYDPSGTYLQRLYVNISMEEQLDEKNFMSLGAGGLFWRAYSQGTEDGRVIRFGPGLSHAYMRYQFSKNIHLQYGYFPYKYNEQAKNLGEYLFRAEAYPVILYTGGWSWMNAAYHPTVGAKLSWKTKNNRIQSDFLLLMEYFNAPIYQVTPAYVGKWNVSSYFQLGAGIALHRWWTPTKNTKKELEKEHLYYEGLHLYDSTGGEGVYITGLSEKYDETVNQWIQGDSARQAYVENAQKSISFDLSTVRPMMFFDLNLNELFGLSREKGLFNVYGEGALLGIKNYPILYTKYEQRLPIMLGLSFPTYFFNHLSFEVEYLKNPHVESLASIYDGFNLVPGEYSEELGKQNDWWWSVHGEKHLSSMLSVYFQVAKDHLRLKDKTAIPNYVPITNKKNHWYWLVRLQWAL